MVFLKEFRKKADLEIEQQTTKKHELPSIPLFLKEFVEIVIF